MRNLWMWNQGKIKNYYPTVGEANISYKDFTEE